MADLDRINIFDYKAPTPEELLRAGGSYPSKAIPLSPPVDRIEKQISITPFRDFLLSDIFNPSGRELYKYGELAHEEVVNPLNYLVVSPPARAAAEVAKKGIQSLPRTKDLVFVHNTSEEAIKSFDAMGGIPSPSIAVTKADQPFTGFGNIQLIGKPEKFDPAVNPANKIYSSDAYTPRAPKKIRLAKEGAAEKLAKDYQDAAKELGNNDMFEQGQYALKNLQKDNFYYPENRIDELERFFHSPLAKLKYAKEKGLDKKNVFNEYYDFKDSSAQRDFVKNWVKKEQDKYLSQDGVFQYFDEFEQTTKTKPYTLDNVVNNMVQETQRGGEGGIGGFGANRLRAVMAEQFKDLPDIRARKEMLTSQHDDSSAMFFDIEEQVAKALGKIDDEAMDYSDRVLDDIGTLLMEGRSIDDAVQSVFSNYPFNNFYNIPTEVMDDIANTIRLNSMRPVQYFEAKPTRAVGFDEFAGAIVPENTSKEVIDILEKRGLKVVKQKFDDIDTDYGKGKIRQQFQDQFFSIGLPAAGASALGIQNTDIFQDDTE